jgi:DNA-binding MarR family transcriptional regulator
MRELAQALACDNSNVTGIVDRLEVRGLVERRAAPHDRRVKMLYVTPEGIELRARVKARMEEPPEPLKRLDPDEQAQLRDLLLKAMRG